MNGGRTQITVKTKDTQSAKAQSYKWWTAGSKQEKTDQLLATATYLKEQQQFRFRQASIHARMYGNLPLVGFAGASMTKQTPNNLPVDRPTMNVVQSCVDTLVARLTQNRPKPLFLTDGGDYKSRNLAKQLNQFIEGEFQQTQAYKHGADALRDASILGTGAVKILETDDNKVALERTLVTELFVDANDAFYGKPRTLYQFKLVDREVVKEMFPDVRSKIDKAEQAYPENSAESQSTVADQIMLVEAWRLPSSKKAKDGRHTIACTSGLIVDEEWNKPKFPFVFFHYSPRLIGFWAQGLSEQLAGTQVEINKLLITISQSINLVGVPRVFVEDGSKVVKAHLNNQIGAIVTYRGTKPEYEVAPCVPAELYTQLQRLIDYAYQQSGISALAATSQKPSGLDSGDALRNYDDLQSDRFTTLSKAYEEFYIELGYQIIDKAKEIAERDGKYQTVYPNKDGTKEIDLPDCKLLEDAFIIQCYDVSSLPKDPAGRLEKVTEMIQAGMIDQREGRRLLNFPDLEQVERLEIAAEERILKALDEIVDTGKYTPPDPFMDLELANKLVVQYYNLYTANKLEESKAQKLRDFHNQVMQIQMAAMPPAPAPMPGADPSQPMATPNQQPQSDLLPIVPQ
jgi:hypothetical protein